MSLCVRIYLVPAKQTAAAVALTRHRISTTKCTAPEPIDAQNWPIERAMDSLTALPPAISTSGIPGRLTPVPRQLSAGCGIAWRMEAAVFAQYRADIERSKIEIEQSVELAL